MNPSVNALLQDRLLQLPKVELHVHLEGSLSPMLIDTLVEKYKVNLSEYIENPLSHRNRYDSFTDFAKSFLFGVSLLREPDDIYSAMLGLGRQLLDDHVRYAEVTWTPQLYLGKGFTLDATLDALNQARFKLENESGLKVRWIPDLVRSQTRPSEHIARWVALKRLQDTGVVALGVGGPEAGYPASALCDAFAVANKYGLPINPHAGETGGAHSVWETLRLTGAKRIGHGVRAIDDADLVAHLATHRIALEICLSSNVGLNLFPSVSDHCIKRLINAGVPIVLNTDDRALFKTTLSNEYFLAVSQAGLTFDDIAQGVRNAVDYSYLPQDEKETLMSEISSCL